jgi:tetratricopeptide (TPR) repeat protein
MNSFCRTAAAVLLALTAVLPTVLAEDEQSKPATISATAIPIDPAQIEQWIEQLGMPSYRVRQEAFVSLWKAGPQAAPMIERVAKGDDLSVASAAKWLLLLQRLGSQADVGDAIRNLGFIQAGDLQTILRLARDKRWSQVLGMLELLNDDQRTALVSDVPGVASAVLISLALQDNQEALVPTLIDYVYPPLQAASIRVLWEQAGIPFEPSRAKNPVTDPFVSVFQLEWQGDVDKAVRQARETVDDELATFILQRNFRWEELVKLLPTPPTEGIENATTQQLDDITRYIMLNDWLDRSDVAEAGRQVLAKTKSQDSLALGSALIATGQVQAGAQTIQTQNPDMAFRIFQTNGDVNGALASVGLEALDEATFSAWMDSHTQIDPRSENTNANFSAVASVGILLNQLGRKEEEQKIIDALVRIADAEFAQDNSRWEMLLRIWSFYDQREHVLTYLAQLLDRGVDRDVMDSLIEPNFATLEQTAPEILRYLKRTSNGGSWRDALNELEMLENASLPERLRGSEQFEKLTEAVLSNSSSARQRLQFANLPESDFDRESYTELIAQLANNLGFLEIAEKLQRSILYASPLYAQLIAARGRLEGGELVLGRIFTLRFPNRTWMGLQRADWLRQLGRIDEADQARRHALMIPCNDLSNARQLRDLGMKSDEILLTEHIFRTCQPNLDRNRFSLNELNLAAEQLASLIEENEPGRAANLYRTAQYDLSSFPRFLATPILQMEAEQLCLTRQAIAAKDQAKADKHFRRAFDLRRTNIDAAIKMVPLAEKAFGKEFADQWYQLHLEQHQKHLEQWPGDAMFHNNMAWLMSCLKRDLDEALRHSEKAVELKKNESTYLDTLAEVEFARGNVDRAIEIAMQCCSLNGLQKHYREQLTRFSAAKSQASQPN